MVQCISKSYLNEVRYLLKFISDSVSQTEAIAETLGKTLKSGTVVAYFGGLGMGKTAFTRGLAKGMGITADVSSPTFAIVNDYGGNPPLVHFDMYKVDSWDDLYSSGFFDYLDMGAILAVEWSENIENALPDNTVRVTINQGENENQRIITIEGAENENFSS
jgi:tRNA threonylcarbamoyladenosine biosynthesis protein TsaE